MSRFGDGRVLRSVTTLVLGIMLAVLFAIASQFMLAPLIGSGSPVVLQVVAPVVFWAVLIGGLVLVIVAVLRVIRSPH